MRGVVDGVFTHSTERIAGRDYTKAEFILSVVIEGKTKKEEKEEKRSRHRH